MTVNNGLCSKYNSWLLQITCSTEKGLSRVLEQSFDSLIIVKQQVIKDKKRESEV